MNGAEYRHPAEARWHWRNGALPPVTFVEAIERLVDTHRGFSFLDATGAERSLSFAELKREAKKRAAVLRARGVKPGDRVALVLPNPADFVLSFLGVVYAGAVAVPMYPPLSLGKLDQYLKSATRILRVSRASLLIASKQVETVLWSVTKDVPALRDILLVETLNADAEHAVEQPPHPAQLDDLVFLQFTSGSTADPKGVRVTHRCLYANSKAIAAGMDADGTTNEHGVSWLPLYHDMGLIGFVLLPIIWLLPVTFIPTLSFIKKPSLWLDVLSKKGGTISFAPNFAYALAAKRVTPEQVAGWDLSRWRIAGCGAEPIQAATMRRFSDVLAPAGFNADAIVPCYGMAESTLAITFNPILSPLRTDQRDWPERQLRPRRGVVRLRLQRARDRHRRRQRAPLADRQVGEVLVKGPSVADGYDDNPSATREAFRDGWLHTGDLGYLIDGELFICGRKKDLVIIKGRNYHPQSIEWELERFPGVRKGNVVAFSVPGDSSETLAIALEATLQAAAARAELKQRIVLHLNEQLGLAAKDVVIVGPGQLPKTSSGKLQRQRVRELFMSGELQRQRARTQGASVSGLTAKLALSALVVRAMGSKLRHRVIGWAQSRAVPGENV